MPNEVETELRRYADHLVNSMPPVTVDEVTRRKPSVQGRLRTRAVLAVIGIAAAFVVVAGLLAVFDGQDSTEVATRESMAPLPPERADRWGDPTGLAAGDEEVWVAMAPPVNPDGAGPSRGEGGIVRVDVATGTAQVWAAVDSMHALAASGQSLWATGFTTNLVTRIDTETGEALAEIPLPAPAGFEDIDGAFLPGHITASPESVWVTTARGAAVRIDPETNEVTDVMPVEADAAGPVAVDGARAWAVEGMAGVALLQPGEAPVHLPVRTGGRTVAVGSVVVWGDSVWAGGAVVDASGEIVDGGAVARLDRETATVTEVLAVPEPVRALAELDDVVWMLGGEGGLYRIADDRRIEKVLELDENVFDLVGVDGRLWSVDAARHNLRVTDPNTGDVKGQALPGGSRDASPGPTHATLFLSSDTHLTVVDIDQGDVDTRPLGELAPGDPPYRLVAREDQLVFYGREGTYRLDPAADKPPSLLEPSEFFIPSAVADRVWLVNRGGDDQDTGFELREVDLNGNQTESARAPAGWPTAAIADGIVLQADDGSLVVWDPGTDEVRSRFPGASLVAAAANVVAWCTSPCSSLHLTDIGTGEERVVPAPEGTTSFMENEGAFSPDAQTLAVPATIAASDEPAALALIDAGSDDARLVPNVRLRGQPNRHLAWDRSGTRLFFELGEGQLGTFRLGSSKAERLAVVVPYPFYGMASR